jgi:hypothetical protein
MGLLSPILRNGTDNRLTWWCPGCEDPHTIQHGAGSGPRWGWNANAERPTFTPSVLVTYGANPDASDEFKEWRTPRVCHSFVVDGAMQFLSDCTHALAGQTVPIPAWPKPEWRDG